MKIKKIQLKNGYKRFHDLTIDLGDDPKRIVALVGPNGCGKSSVFDGMIFFNNARRAIGSFARSKNYEYHSMHKTPNFNQTNILIDFNDKKFETMFQEKSVQGKENTIFSFRSPYRYNSNLKVIQSSAREEIRLNNYGATYTTDIDAKMEENYRRLHIKYNEYLDKVDCRPSEAKEEIMGEINLSLKNCLDLTITSIGNIEASKGTLFFRKPDHGTEFDFNVLSSGEKEVVDILLDLYLRKDVYNDTIFIIDEPELHINTSIQRKLLLEINKLIGENCQIWIATHSLGFLRALQEDLRDKCQIIYFSPGVNWASEEQILKPMPPKRTRWQEIFETALDDLTGLIAPKRIIYCEGKDKPGTGGEEQGLDAVVYNNIFSEKYPETIFVSSGGNTELDKRSEIGIAILSKVFSDIEILVLKDRDMLSGREETKNSRDIYLENNPKNHRVLKRLEIENYLYDKDVLKGYCLTKNLQFNEEEYNSFVTDIENQSVKDETGRIKNYCDIRTSITPECFKKALSLHIKEGMAVYSELEECIFGRR